MPLDPALAVGQEFTGGRTFWRREDIVLYQLSLGAGDPPTEERELAYTGVRPLAILPTFAVIPTSGITADLNATPDLVPPLAAVALLAPGPSRLTGIGHLRVKESDRLAALAREFSRLGGHVTTRKDELLITPQALSGASVSAHGDHRIAMALAVAALRVPGTGPGDPEMSCVDLDDPDCVGKSYPGFFEDLARLL